MDGWNMKKLGFGLMRLPKDEQENIIIPKMCEMVDAFMEKGFTYFDTAYVYAGSEEAFKQAVSSRYPRDSYTVASKMASWLFNDTYGPADMFQESLDRCGVDYFDYYLIHSLQPTRVPLVEKYGCWEFCNQMKKEGKIRHLGFSYHGAPDLLDQILTEHPETEFVQLQLNYVDWDSNAIYSRANYEVCVKHGKVVTVMEPIKGGMLAEVRPELEAKLKTIDPEGTPSSCALRFAGSLENVKVVLSGMGTLEQMQQNLATFEDFKPLTEEDKKVMKEVADGILAVKTVPCTACHYCCDGCPQSINIPEIFKAYNMILTWGDHARPHFYYEGTLFGGSAKASECVQCGQCEAACPQHIDIIEQLKAASSYLDQ